MSVSRLWRLQNEEFLPGQVLAEILTHVNGVEIVETLDFSVLVDAHAAMQKEAS